MSAKHENVSGTLRTYAIVLRLAGTSHEIHGYATEDSAVRDVPTKVADAEAIGSHVRTALVAKLCGLCGGTGRLIENPRTREDSECDECDGTGMEWERVVWNGSGERLVQGLRGASPAWA